MEVVKNTEVNKYEEVLDDIKLLAVDDSGAGLKIIEKYIEKDKK